MSDGTLSNTKTDTIVIGLPPTAAINASSTTICPGSSTTLTASGGTSYTWSTGDTTASITKSPTSTTTYSVTVSNGPSCTATAQQQITVRSAPNANAGNNINACVGDSIQTTATGGVHYQWSTGDTTAHISALASQPATFGIQVTVTDASGCTATSGLTVNIGNRATVNVPDQSVCGASSATLNAGNTGAHFHWSTGDTTQSIQVSTPGQYIVTVTNNGCAVTDTANVSISASLPVSVADVSVCQGDTAQLDAGYPGGTHVWSTSDTGRVISVTAAGTYTVTVTSNGCSGSDTATVTLTPLPTVDAGNDQTVCQNTTVTIGSSPVNGTTYNWIPTGSLTAPTASQTDATPQTTTSYILIAQQNGCTASDTVTITVNPAPTVNFGGLGGPYCVDNTNDIPLQGIPSGGTFTGPGISTIVVTTSGTHTQGVPVDAYFNPSVAGAGVHQIIYSYTDPNSGCVGRDTQYVTVNAIPQPTISGLPAQMCIQDAPVTLTLDPVGGTLSGPGTNGSVFDPSQTAGGTITIQYDYSDSAGCSGSTTATVEVISVPVSASGVAGSYCLNDNTDYALTGTPSGGTFSGPGVSGSTFNPSVAGVGIQHIVYSYNNGTCTFTDTLTAEVDGVILNANDTTICMGNDVTLTASGSISYLWSTGATTASITVSPTDTTTYTVTADNLNGCTATASVTVNPVPAPTVTFTGLNASYCSNEQAVTLVGSPSGGTFTGYGLNDSIFDPMTAPLGGPYPITYTYTNSYGCTDSVKHFVQVIASPTATISVLDSAYCYDALPVTLNGQPTGGYYAGDGISNGVFVPYYAGVGQHTITYTSPQASGCAASVTYHVTVNALPTVTLDPIAASYCVNAGPVQLTGSPAGGVYSGPGVSSSTFNPGMATAGGPQVVQYTYTDSNGCKNSAFNVTEVNSLPSLQVTGLAPSYCTNSNAVSLSGVPSGGTFSGPGMDFNLFNPDSAGAGTHTIVYTYTTSAGCVDSLLTTVKVKATPNVLIYNLDSAYCFDAVSFRVDASPLGGSFSGNGMIGNVFDPVAAGAGGPYNISYTYTDTNGCSKTDTKTVTVYPAANLVLSGLDNTYCNTITTAIPIHAQPEGGLLNGAGVVDSSFTPSLAGPGVHTILYLYTNPLGCVSYQTVDVTVISCLDGIDEATQFGSIKVYPNPTNGMLNIELNGFTDNDGTANLYNMQGQQVFTEKLNNISGNTVKQINLSDLAKGIYMLRIQTASGSRIEKIVVQ